MEKRWRVELLGRLRATRGDREIGRFRTQKTALLFAYLAHSLRRPHPRGELLELLWPELRVDAARANLSNALSWLRRQLQPESIESATGTDPSELSTLILADHATVQLNPALFVTDVAEFEAALQAAARAANPDEHARSLSEAVDRYRGELLPGYFESWVLQERQWLAERYFTALGQLLKQLEAAGQVERALQYGQHGVRADPLREEIHRELIRLYAVAGQPAAARRQYDELRRVLKEELGTEPDAATQALLLDLERHAAGPSPPAAQPERTAPDPGQKPNPNPVSAVPTARRVALLYRRHAQPDERLLTLLETRLREQGHRVFVDRHLAVGTEWAREIEREVREADAVIPLLSAAAVTSEMLAYEIETAHEAAHAQSGRPRLLPVRVNLTEPLPTALAAILDPLVYSLWEGPQSDERLVRDVLQALTDLEAPSPVREATAPPFQPFRPAGVPVIEPSAPHPRSRPVGGVVPLDSPFYVVRPTDEEFREAIAHRDSVVLIKGARQMGKTSLLARGLQQARAAGTRVVLTDLQMIDLADLASLDRLYLTLADAIAFQLHLEVLPEQVWKPHLGASTNFERYLQREVLGRGQPLVWGLDEVDRLFSYDYSSQVFGLFRSWHNRRGLDPTGPWSQITLAIAYATEAHLFITDINQSPFNVGTRLTLQEFTAAHVRDLNQRFGAPLRDEVQVERYQRLVNGHPYLVSRGFQEMVTHGLSMDTFEAEVDRDEGFFGDHLRRMLVLLVKDPALCDAVRALLRGEPCPTLDSFYRLRSAGVLAGEAVQQARLRCPIYATYLKRHLL